MSEKIRGNIGNILKEQNMCRYYRPLTHVGNIGLNWHNVKASFNKTTSSEGLYNSP